ncbi:tellurite resistance TerB C-terminal domain-containing protein [uncultured Anaerococcus sp.]|uniref:tellurite resistance TerB C-terminal domain-containing protein n=1 Tax=uncultured Anaerococcus sp. TaxID=293428 RepID=UPI0025D3D803|nr:tellurite resistance TerB C-terminal domain-containing protein [uncultured Anaerococcus sp.]
MDDVRNLIENLLDDIKDVEKKKIHRKVETDKFKANINLSFEEKTDSYYVSKLRLMGNTIDLPSQLKSQSLKLYINFARLADKKIEKINSSYLYNQLYILARDYVEDYVDPNYENKGDRIYDLIYKLCKKDLRPYLKPSAKDFLKSFPKLKDETKEFYKLTANGKAQVFWDPNGALREKYSFTKAEERALIELSKRRNVLWESDDLSKFTINLFLKTIKEAFERDDIDTDILTTYQRPYTLSKNLLDSLLIITEANVRRCFSFLAEIKTDKAEDLLIENSCKDLLEFFKAFQESFLKDLNSNKIDKIYYYYIKKNPSKISDLVSFIERADIGCQEDILKEFKDYENFSEIIDKLLVSDFIPTRVLALTYIYRDDDIKTKYDTKLFSIIREDNFDEFISLINKKDFGIDLVKDVLALKNKKAKKIRLNQDRIDRSRKDLSKTVKNISDFVGETDEFFDEEDENIEVPNEEDTYSISDDTRKVLGEIINKGQLAKGKAESMAMDKGLFLNVFINNINDELYDYINDQTLLIDGDRIIIDEFYVEMVKELVDD